MKSKRIDLFRQGLADGSIRPTQLAEELLNWFGSDEIDEFAEANGYTEIPGWHDDDCDCETCLPPDEDEDWSHPRYRDIDGYGEADEG
jgi:hypothetical protein